MLWLRAAFSFCRGALGGRRALCSRRQGSFRVIGAGGQCPAVAQRLSSGQRQDGFEGARFGWLRGGGPSCFFSGRAGSQRGARSVGRWGGFRRKPAQADICSVQHLSHLAVGGWRI